MSASPARVAWGVALLAQAALAGGLVLWAGAVAGVVLSAPLLLTLPGLLRCRPRAAALAGYLMILYVAALLAEAFAMRARHAPALALACTAVVAFLALILFVRWAARERALQTASAERMESSADAGR